MRIVITLLLAATAAVAIAGIQHTILHGVSIGRVGCSMSPDQPPGLTDDDATALMKARLRDAGIPVTPGQGATLWVSATVVHEDSPACFVKVEGQLVEEATLDRNGLPVRADSWHGGGTVATTTPADCAHTVRKAIDRAMRDFIEMHQAMNGQP